MLGLPETAFLKTGMIVAFYHSMVLYDTKCFNLPKICVSSSTISCCLKCYHMGQLPQIRPNLVKILAGAGFGRISKKRPDARFAGAGAEIRYIPTNNLSQFSINRKSSLHCVPLSEATYITRIWVKYKHMCQ